MPPTRKVKKIAHKILSKGEFELSTKNFSAHCTGSYTISPNIFLQGQHCFLEARIYFPPINPHFLQLEDQGFALNFHNFVRGSPLNFEFFGFCWRRFSAAGGPASRAAPWQAGGRPPKSGAGKTRKFQIQREPLTKL